MASLALYFPDSGKPRILETEGHESSFVWVIGRHPDCEIVFRDNPRISRHHARIRFEEEAGMWQVIDSQSTNGTWLNGESLPPGVWTNIVEGDEIWFGAKSCRIICSYDTSGTITPKDDTPTGAGVPPIVSAPPPTIDNWAQAVVALLDDATPLQLVLYAILGLLAAFVIWLLFGQ